MKIGTRSVLFGSHQFLLHPLFVARSWARLYGFPWDPRLWFCFFLHDIGYLGKPNMDGWEGERHVLAGARIVGHLFGFRWHQFCVLHSRYWSKQVNLRPSALCFADKMAFVETPRWLYLFLARLSGELREYMREYRPGGKYEEVGTFVSDERDWWTVATNYSYRWVFEHLNGKEDTWTRARGKPENLLK